MNFNPKKLRYLLGSGLLLGISAWGFAEGLGRKEGLLILAVPALILGVWGLKLGWQMPDDDPSDDPPA